jgi:hypothetical protein
MLFPPLRLGSVPGVFGGLDGSQFMNERRPGFSLIVGVTFFRTHVPPIHHAASSNPPAFSLSSSHDLEILLSGPTPRREGVSSDGQGSGLRRSFRKQAASQPTLGFFLRLDSMIMLSVSLLLVLLDHPKNASATRISLRGCLVLSISGPGPGTRPLCLKVSSSRWHHRGTPRCFHR